MFSSIRRRRSDFSRMTVGRFDGLRLRTTAMELILKSRLSKALTYHLDSIAVFEGQRVCWWDKRMLQRCDLGSWLIEFRGHVWAFGLGAVSDWSLVALLLNGYQFPKLLAQSHKI